MYLFIDDMFGLQLHRMVDEYAIMKAWARGLPGYRCGDLVDLCRGPHLPNTNRAKAG